MPEGQNIFHFETNLNLQGITKIAGVDEAGRGCLAGPVVAASVILPKECLIQGIDDSKKLTPKKRSKLFDEICRDAISYGIGVVDSVEIDKINILQASLKAMGIAVRGMDVTPEYLLIDGPFPIKTDIDQRPIKKGDSLSISIAAASILAKVTRDRMMVKYEEEFSQFKFSLHKGYGTKLHLEELRKIGPTPIHRFTFRGVV